MDASFVRMQIASQKFQYRGFASSTSSDKCSLFAALDITGEVFKYYRSFVVGEVYIFDIYIALFVDEVLAFIVSLDGFGIVEKISNFLDVGEVFSYVFEYLGRTQGRGH